MEISSSLFTNQRSWPSSAYRKSPITEKLEKLLNNTGDMALKRRARRIIEELDPKNGDKILEVGCGDGFYLHLLSSLGLRIDLTGIDIDRKALASAKKNLRGKKVKLAEADLMQKLPFKRNSFNKVIMSEVLEHLANDLKGLKEVWRVLKKNGNLVITVPNHNYPFLWDPINWFLEHSFGLHIKKGFFAGLWNQHLRLYKPFQLKKVVQKANFEVRVTESLTWWCLPFNHYLVNIVARILAGGKLTPEISSSISKYETNPKRSLLLNTAFTLVNILDRLNDIYQPKNRGVGVLLKAVKTP